MIADSRDLSKFSTDLMKTVTYSHAQTTPYRRQNRQASRPLVYVTRRIPQEGVTSLLNSCNVKQWDSEQAVPRGELLYSVVGVDGILCMQGDNVDADVLDAAGPRLRVVATMSDGTKHIDMEECHRRGIQVITCPYQPTEVFAELTIALVLLTIKESQTDEERLSSFEIQPPDLLANDPVGLSSMAWTNTRPRFLKHLSEQQTLQWTHGKLENTKSLTWRKLAKKTFGVFGLTMLGLRVAKILKDIGFCNILITDTDAVLDNFSVKKSRIGCTFVSFDELLEKSDIICVCGSVGQESNELFCRESFQKMKKQVILIVSQSQERAVNYVDLYAALRDGQIKAAGLNDCNQEPVPFKTLLLALKNCIFLPQTQEGVYDMRHKVSACMAKSLTEALTKTTKTVDEVVHEPGNLMI